MHRRLRRSGYEVARHGGHTDVRGYALSSVGSAMGDNAEAIGRAEL